MPVTLLLIRHGETDWNRSKIFRGAHDIPLNDNGRRQAQLLAAALADMEIDDMDSIDMLRKLKILQPKAEIIILSAQTRQHIEQQIAELSISNILEKPFNSDQIRSIAKEALDLLNKENEGINKTEEV